MAMSSMLGGMAGGAASNAISDVLGNALGAVFSMHSAKKAYQRQKTIMKNMIQWRVKDLVKAGLNPMLAVGAGVGGQSVSVAPAHQPDVRDPNPVQDAASAGDLMMAAARNPSEIAVNSAQAAAANQAVETGKSQVSLNAAHVNEANNRAGLALDQAAEARANSARLTGTLGPEVKRLEAAAQAERARAGALEAQRLHEDVRRQRAEQGKLGRLLGLTFTERLRATAAEKPDAVLVKKLGEGIRSTAERARSQGVGPGGGYPQADPALMGVLR